MKILIGIIGNDAARFHLFTASVMQLDTEGLEVQKEMLIGGDWCGARNDLARMTLDGDFTHLWFMDDDHAFAPDLLKRLVAHNVPLINPLCLARVAPFPLVTYAVTDDGKAHLPIDLNGLPGEGLVEIHAGGCAGMLIRRDVLEATRPAEVGEPPAMFDTPWFEYGDRSEDVIFCEKARSAGFKLYVDLAARLGHITTTVVYPDMDQGNWMTRLKIGGGLDLFVSPAQDWVGEDQELTAPATETFVQPAIEEAQAAPMLDAVAVLAPQAERVEVWMDAENYWHWRAVPAEGDAILGKGGGIREDEVLAAAEAAFPGIPMHVIQREIDDSRSTKPRYGPPTRLWNRGNE